MKKLLFAVSALAALSLLAPSTGFAQDVPPEWVNGTNVLSLYADEAGTLNEMTMGQFTSSSVYLVVHNPYNWDFDGGPRYITSIGGIEFAIYPSAGILVTTLSWPVVTVDVGSGVNHLAGFNTPILVTDGSALICTINIVLTGTSGTFTLGPATPSSIVGWEAMACLDVADDLSIVPLLPPYMSFDYTVLAINETVATESTTMDAVKAMYR